MSQKGAERIILPPKAERQQYFFRRFELDVQNVFNEICNSKHIAKVKVNSLMKRSNMYSNSDYFMPLKSHEGFQLNCEELLNNLREIKYVSHVEVDSNFNLTFCLNRSFIFDAVLNEITSNSIDYGVTEHKSIFVLVHNDETNSFISNRNNLLAKHIISVLSCSKLKVYYYGVSLDTNSCVENAVSLKCSSDCNLSSICSQMKDKLSLSEWKKESADAEDVCIDAKSYLETHSSLEKYGKDINTIVLSNEDNNDILGKVSLVKHLLNDHIKEIPDLIIHIASHGVCRTVWKVGITLQMLEKSSTKQSYIFNQSVKVNNGKNLTYEDYILSHKSGIENAMSHKYDVDICQDNEWSVRIQNLVDSVVKFDFLKLNPNISLKLDLSNSHSTEKNTGIFVQYNFARLSNLFKKFDLKVQEGYYEPLTPLEDVDFSLLRLEEEWNLFQYVVQFPKIVERITDSLLSDSTLKTRYPVNGICVMLSELCHFLSLYYSKIRILAGPQKHLQTLMNARLWLLKGIFQILLKSFTLLDIKGLDQM